MTLSVLSETILCQPLGRARLAAARSKRNCSDRPQSFLITPTRHRYPALGACVDCTKPANATGKLPWRATNSPRQTTAPARYRETSLDESHRASPQLPPACHDLVVEQLEPLAEAERGDLALDQPLRRLGQGALRLADADCERAALGLAGLHQRLAKEMRLTRTASAVNPFAPGGLQQGFKYPCRRYLQSLQGRQ
jgi:hypothetical protein